MSTPVSPAIRDVGAAVYRLGLIWYRYDAPEIQDLSRELALAVPGETYVASRACGLGAAPAADVVAALGLLPPPLCEATVQSAWAKTDPATFAERYLGAVVACAERMWAEVEGLGDLAATLTAAVARADMRGRPLPAGFAALAEPSSPAGRVAAAAHTLREYRFAGHLVAISRAGITSPQALAVSELWRDAEPAGNLLLAFWGVPAADVVAELEAAGLVADGSLTPAGRAERDEIEALTDELATSPWAGTSDAALGALARRLDTLADTVDFFRAG